MKSKGARLTTEISLAGRFVVFVPSGEGFGVSRRLEDDERVRLRDILKSLNVKKGGLIVRTAAEGASAEDIERDFDFLQRLWKTIEQQAKASQSPALVYQEAELPLRVTRDLFTEDFERALVDDDITYKRIVGYLKKTSPHMAERVEPAPVEGAAARGVRRRCGDQVDALAAGRPAVGRLPRLRLRRGVHRHRRQHGPLRRLALEVVDPDARGHDHQEQHRGGQGGRAPAAAARHRRDHRHRLHRHGEPEEPRERRGGAAPGARARPDEDLRRRDLTARARRDDAPERDRRAARDPRQEVPGLRAATGSSSRSRRRPSTSSSACARSCKGSRNKALPDRGQRARREHPHRARRTAPRGPRGGVQAALHRGDARRRPARPLRRAGAGCGRGARAGAGGRGQRGRPEARRDRAARQPRGRRQAGRAPGDRRRRPAA